MARSLFVECRCAVCVIFAIPFAPYLWHKANSEKEEFSQLQKQMRHRVFSAKGIQTGSFAAREVVSHRICIRTKYLARFFANYSAEYY